MDDELIQQYIDLFKENANVPIKITYMDYSNVTKDPFSQEQTGSPVHMTIYKICAIKEGKRIGEDDSSILLTSIPAGKIGVYFIKDDFIDVKSMDTRTKKTLKFEIYYDTDYPQILNPEEQVVKIQYLYNVPMHQVFICGVEK